MNLESKIVWGGLYKVKHSRWEDAKIGNNQIYHQAVPCRRKDGTIWMQDTHQLEPCSMKKRQSKTEAAIERIISLQDEVKGDWVVCHSRGQWYHDGNEQLTESRLDDYELICDLNEYRPFEYREDYRDYDPSDIVCHIHLYDEHGYSWDYGDIGVKLVRKDAKPLVYNKFLAAVEDTYSDCKKPYCYSIHYDDMIKLHKQLIDSGQRIHPKEQTRYENVIWLSKRLKEMQDEIEDYFKEHKYKPHYDYEDNGIPLKEIHPDVARYLQEDCYCPGEIYNSGGFFYQLFYEDTICKVIWRSESRCAVISRSPMDSECEPQVIVFWYDEENNPNIIAAQRMDVTENNIKIAKEIVYGEKRTTRSDKYTGKEFPEDINRLINSC